MKKRIFISHIHEEANLGAVIAEWVGEAFAGHPVQPFLSSDDNAIAAGQKWLDVVKHELDGTAVMISLLSATSLARPWVNIELGAAWIREVPIIPLCHSGLSSSTLPRPFSDFQAIGLDQDNAAARLIEGVGRHLGIPHSKRLHFADLLKEMRSASAKSEVLQVVNEALKSIPTKRPDAQVTILQSLAASENRGREEVEMSELIRTSGLSATVFKLHSQKLDDENLVNVSYYGNGDRIYRISPDGVSWLDENGLMPD
jgi:hypothetical protein